MKFVNFSFLNPVILFNSCSLNVLPNIGLILFLNVSNLFSLSYICFSLSKLVIRSSKKTLIISVILFDLSISFLCSKITFRWSFITSSNFINVFLMSKFLASTLF